MIGKASIGIAYENYNGISPDSLRNYDRNSLLLVNFLPIYQILKIFIFIYRSSGCYLGNKLSAVYAYY